MLSQTFAVLAAAAFVSAKTPAGFEPAATTDLIVDFRNMAAMNGAVVAKEGIESITKCKGEEANTNGQQLKRSQLLQQRRSLQEHHMPFL